VESPPPGDPPCESQAEHKQDADRDDSRPVRVNDPRLKPGAYPWRYRHGAGIRDVAAD
jgi:hypothetical protein